jgi:hypothetical protein
MHKSRKAGKQESARVRAGRTRTVHTTQVREEFSFEFRDLGFRVLLSFVMSRRWND